MHIYLHAGYPHCSWIHPRHMGSFTNTLSRLHLLKHKKCIRGNVTGKVVAEEQQYEWVKCLQYTDQYCGHFFPTVMTGNTFSITSSLWAQVPSNALEISLITHSSLVPRGLCIVTKCTRCDLPGSSPQHWWIGVCPVDNIYCAFCSNSLLGVGILAGRLQFYLIGWSGVHNFY